MGGSKAEGEIKHIRTATIALPLYNPMAEGEYGEFPGDEQGSPKDGFGDLAGNVVQ